MNYNVWKDAFRVQKYKIYDICPRQGTHYRMALFATLPDIIFVSRRSYSVLRGTCLPRRDDVWHAAQSPHCARYARLCGVIERMSLRDISQARVCRAARIRMDAHFYRASVPVGTRGVRRQHFYQAFAPVGAFMCDGAQFLQICNA